MNYKSYIFLLIFSLTIACQNTPEETTQLLRPVRYHQIQTSSEQRTRVFTGLSKPGVESKISFKINGTLSQLYAKIGREVVQGALIAVLDDSDYLLQYEEADAGVKNADAMEKSAKSNFERISALYENENVSLAEYESAKAAFDSAKANEKAMKQRRKLAESQLSYTRLQSPITGIISTVLVEENENVSAGQPIVVVTSADQLEVEVSVPDLYISQIAVKDQVKITFSAFRDRSYAGMVTEVGFASGYQTTYPVILRVNQIDENIRPGMTAEVSFDVSAKTTVDKIYIPTHSVSEDEKDRFVYLVKPIDHSTGNIVRKSVQVGPLSELGVEIIEGLKDGDLIVTAGVSKIKDGMQVRLLK